MAQLKNKWFLIFILFYIVIEISLRNYAIDVIGTIHVLPYKIEALELLGRFISSIGFSIFVFKSVKYIKELEGFFKRLLSFIIIFSSIFLTQKLIFENIDVFVSDEKTESIYYANLFKDASYYNEMIKRQLPYSITEKDTAGFKTFYGLSLFLYNNSDDLESAVKNNEDHYVRKVTQNYFNEKEIEKLITESYSDVTLSHNILMEYHAKLEKSFNKITEEIYEKKILVDFVNNIRLNYMRSVNNYRSKSGYQLTEKMKSDIPSRTKSNYNRVINYALKDIGVQKVNNIYKDAIDGNIRAYTNKELNYIIKGYFNNSINFDYEYFKQLMRVQYYSETREQAYEIFSFIFKGLTRNDFDKYIFDGFMIKRNNGLNNFPQNSNFKYLKRKYQDWLIDDMNDLKNFLTYYNNNRSSFTSEMIMLDDYIKENSSFKNEIKNKFLQYVKYNLKEIKNDHELMGKSLLIPPLVMLVSDIALFLNIALFINMLIFREENQKIKERIVLCSVFFGLLFISGINLKESRFEKFDKVFIEQYTDIPQYKVTFVNWFINKNNNLEKIHLDKINVLSKITYYIEYYEAKKSLEEKDMLSVIYEDDINSE